MSKTEREYIRAMGDLEGFLEAVEELLFSKEYESVDPKERLRMLGIAYIQACEVDAFRRVTITADCGGRVSEKEVARTQEEMTLEFMSRDEEVGRV